MTELPFIGCMTLGMAFTFVDLFAGIGGIRLAFEKVGGRSIFSSEIDNYCKKTYFANFGEQPTGDINKVILKTIPDHDILTAGFPCQPFSIAGVSKKKSLGDPHGFKDKTQGTLFFKIAEILRLKRPPIFFLENVKNLRGHNNGKTFRIIREKIENLNYTFFSKVLDAVHYVPQHRERLYIVGFDKKVFGESPQFKFPEPPQKRNRIGSILEKKYDRKYIISDRLWKWLRDYAEKHRKKGNGFGFSLTDLNTSSRTLSARYYKDGSEILIPVKNSNPRRLTPRECARIMGFEDHFNIPVSDTQAYRQFGNSVVVPLITDIALEIARTLNNSK